MIYLWRGFHSPELMGLIDRAWTKGDLLVLCPAHVKDFEFVLGLPQGAIQLEGAWEETHRKSLESFIFKRKFQNYPQYPVLGVFTTGTTTGKARLILYTKDNIMTSLENIRSCFSLEKLTTLFCYPQPTHAFGLILGYLHSYLYKLELVTGVGRYSKNYHDLWLDNENDGTLTLGTPTHFEDLMGYVSTYEKRPQGSYSSIVGGAKTTVDHWVRQQSELFIEAPSVGYGASEAALGVTHHKPGLKPLENGEIGYALPHLQMKIREGVGVEIRGPSTCLAIIENGNVEFPQSILLRDNLEYRQNDKIYVYRGRFEFILNRGGFKFSLEHLENTVNQKLNTQVICVPVADVRLGEELGVISTDPEKDKIFDVLYATFGHSFNRNNFRLINEFPVNTNLKIDRLKCAQFFKAEGND